MSRNAGGAGGPGLASHYLWGADVEHALGVVRDTRNAIEAGCFSEEVFLREAQRLEQHIEGRLAEQRALEPYREAFRSGGGARREWPGELEMDHDAHVSASPDGAYVQCWVWVPRRGVGGSLPDVPGARPGQPDEGEGVP